MRHDVTAIAGGMERTGAPARPDRVAEALGALAAHGYGDGALTEPDGSVALAQTHRPASRPVPRFQTPCRVGDLVVVADARLDDRDRLIDRLGLSVDRGAYPDDRVLLAEAYRRWGRECPDELVGDFAFAIWDPAGHGLFCARDPVGARPLYVHRSPERFVFASDPRAVVAFGVPDTVDEEAVARYLADPLAIHPGRTLFAQIGTLLPGRSLWVTRATEDERVYWTPFDMPDIALPSPKEYADQLRELIQTAVDDRLPDSGVAAHLSGGLDSSAIAAMAARTARARGGPPPLTFSWSPPVSDAFPSTARDERQRIEVVADREGLDCLYPLVDASDYRAFLTRDIRPTANALVIEWAAMPQVAERGVRTVLSGWGGDEAATFDGRGYFPDLFARGRWVRVARALHLRFGKHPARWGPAFRDRVVAPLLPDAWVRRLTQSALVQAPPPLAHPDLVERTAAFREPPALLRERRGSRAMQRALLEHGHLSERMDAWTLWGAPHGVRYAYPLTDRRVLEFVYRVPVDLHVSGRYSRHLFREAMDGVLPDDLRWRISKFDPATERQRAELRLALWRLLAAEVEAGQWDTSDCPWVDLPRLRESIRHVPARLGGPELHQLIRIVSAVEMVHLWERVRRTGRGCGEPEDA